MTEHRFDGLRLGATLLVTALATSACASGGHHGPRGGPPGGGPGGGERPSLIVRPGALLLVDFDSDHDLRVTRAEMQASASAAFTRADANKDSALSPIEYGALAEAHLGTADSTPGRLYFDSDANGAITAAEFAAGAEALFNQFDADHDGVVTRAEMVQRFEPAFQRGPGDEGGMMRGGPGGGRRGPGGGGPGG